MAAWNPRANDIFLDAAEIPLPEAREAYVNQACGCDASLRNHVDALLQAAEQVGSFLETPATGVTMANGSTTIRELPGVPIGPYKLLQQIGEGGMGVVFMAEQTEPVQRFVALKIVKPGMDTRQVIARFEAERQALAMMDHPNIATVLDAGATDSGQPYFVMELVKGVPITKYCEERPLSLRERLELLLPVCYAVQHAHQKGVIHRDIKPTNVLIAEYDSRAVPKVIDFGVAKATARKLTERTMFTEFGQVVGTFEYMSPEQAKLNQIDVDTRSDIYSLGVLLYELLTGSTPFERRRLRDASFDEALRIIREEEPAKPSTHLNAASKATTISADRGLELSKLSKLVRGELDWVVMKALEKDRHRRYATAKDLASDIERFLRDEPVEARSPSASYRVRKFARRNKAIFLGGAVVTAAVLVAVCSLIGGVVTLATSNSRIVAEQQQTKLALQRETETSYVQRIALAERELGAGNVGRAEELLDECPADGRGWEWHLLKRQRYGSPPPMKHNHTVVRAAFSPDGRQLATALIDGSLTIRESCTGEVLHVLEPEAASLGEALPGGMAYSPDGRYLASARKDGKIRVWDPSNGQLFYTLEAHRGPAWQVAFSPDSQTMASGGSDRSVRLWDLASGQALQEFSAHPAAVKGVAFRPDGRSVVAACDDATVKVWDRESDRETFSFRGEGLLYPWAAWFTPDARRLAWSCLDGFIKVWDTTTGQLEINQQSNTHQCRGVAYSPDGKRIAVAGFDGTLRILDARTGREMLTIFAHSGPVSGLTFSPDGNRLASTSYDHTVRVWDATPLASDPLAPFCVRLTGHTDKVSQVVFSPNGRWIASASWDHTIKLWEVPDGAASTPAAPRTTVGLGAITLRHTLTGHRGILSGLAFSSDNRLLASAGWDKAFKLWDLQPESQDSPNEINSLGFGEKLNSIAFSPEGKLVAVGQQTGIALLDAATGKPVHPFKKTPAAVPGIAFHPNRPLLISTGASDPAVKVWAVDADKPSFEIRHNFHPSPSVAISPDGRRIVSPGRDYSGDHTVKIWNIDWDAKKFTEFRTLKGHRGYAWKVALSLDGRYLASGSWDSTIKIWDLEAPESAEPVTLRGHAGAILGLAFSPDGRRLASGSGHAGHGEVMVWDTALWDKTRRERSIAFQSPPK